MKTKIQCIEGSIGLKEHILIRTLTFNFFTYINIKKTNGKNFQRDNN